MNQTFRDASHFSTITVTAALVCSSAATGWGAQFMVSYQVPGLTFSGIVDTQTDRLTLLDWSPQPASSYLDLDLLLQPVSFAAMRPADFGDTVGAAATLTPDFDIPDNWNGGFASAANPGWLFVADRPSNQQPWTAPGQTTSFLQSQMPALTRMALGGTDNGTLSATTDLGRLPSLLDDPDFGPEVTLAYAWENAAIQIQSIPEPSAPLLLVSSAGLCLMLRRRTKNFASIR